MRERVLIDFVDFIDLERESNPFVPILRRRFDLVASEYPDYVFFTHEGQRHRLYPCTKIFYTQESFTPNWRACDYAILSIKLEDRRAFHLPYYSLWREAATLVRPDGTDYGGWLKAKTGFCSFLVGYVDRSVEHRTRFFQKLNARRRVDSGGRALNNLGRSVAPGLAAKLDFLRPYKFHLAFENREVPGYVTEKIVDAFMAGAVPVYWGDTSVKQQFNPAAFIDRRDFETDEACIEHILKVEADDTLYLRYLSATPFRGNQPNREWDHERLLDFLEQAFRTPPDPVARRRWFFGLTKWRLVKRVKTHEEKGMETARQRFEQRRRTDAFP
jgi:hypothetical protein